MRVLKFGGTSVANAESIQKVIKIVQEKAKNEKLVIVVSAFSGVTNLLIGCGKLAQEGNAAYKNTIRESEKRHLTVAKALLSGKSLELIVFKIQAITKELEDICHGIALLNEISPRTNDYLLGFGERLSALIIAESLNEQGVKTRQIDARELIITDENFGNAKVDFDLTFVKTKSKLSDIQENILVNGFVAASRKRHYTTLGRGGSDYSASIIAAATDAEMLELWTDVSGVMTADPQVVETAYPLEKLSYEEAMELSHFGAKIIFPPSIQPVLQKEIPILIKNTFAPHEKGTLISKDEEKDAKSVRGLSHVNEIALFTLTGGGMVGVTGTVSRLFSALSIYQVNVIFITQASSEHTITVGIKQNNVEKARTAINSEFEAEIVLSKIEPVQVEEGLSVVALIGDNMKASIGLSGRTFSALGKNGINVRAIAQGSTERNISVVISQKDVVKAMNVLHEQFFLSKVKKIHLFLMGVGYVGKTFIAQLNEQADYLREEFHIDIKIIALSNSKKMLFDERSISPQGWENRLQKDGEKARAELFVEKMKALNLRNSVFVDNTASASISEVYEKVLAGNISLVASNKIATSSAYSYYKRLNELATKNNVKFLYETNVGAGLPVITTIQNMIKSGDKIFKIEAVLSGSLNFIFNNFTENSSFYDTVRQAMREGYTEPDPRIDLGGVDVMRKILILAREVGAKMELEAVENKKFVPAACFESDSVDDFLASLKKQEAYFEKIRKTAEKRGEKLRFIATYENGKARVELQSVNPQKPYYQLDGKDNIVVIYSNRYKKQPLVVKGAGAGAEVTASGIFADIISIANQ